MKANCELMGSECSRNGCGGSDCAPPAPITTARQQMDDPRWDPDTRAIDPAKVAADAMARRLWALHGYKDYDCHEHMADAALAWALGETPSW